MKIYHLLLTALVAVLFIGCSSSSSNGDVAPAPQSAVSPTDTLKSFFESSKKKDVEAIKKSLSKNSLALAEKSAKAENTTVDELFKRDNPALPDEMPEIRNEKIEGETASVEVKDKTAGYDTIPFVREEGVWKIAFDKYQQAMREKPLQEMSTTANANVSKPDGDKPANAPANKPNANK